MKYIYSLLALLFLLIACGTESTKPTRDSAYNYVEIEECTIPVSKKMIHLKDSIGMLYRFAYDSNNGIDDYLMNFSKVTDDRYVNLKENIVQNKDIQIISESEQNHFKILQFNVIDPLMNNAYYLVGPKTEIYISHSNDTKVNYLLNYCQKTWKLNKGKNNASTSK